MPEPLEPSAFRELVRQALAEDVGSGDITTRATVPEHVRAEAAIVAKGSLVLAGLDVAGEAFVQGSPGVGFAKLRQDGERVVSGDRVATVTGFARSILAAERTGLNFLQYLSGIATATRAFVDAAGGHLTVLDTRKTTPTLRAMAKYAVRCGGGTNHRFGLYDAILIKDNHIRIAGGVAEAVRRVRASGSTLPIEAEAQSLAEVDAALAADVDVIMLDNFDDATTREALSRIKGRAKVELSGNMTVDRVRALAACGADFVSIGAITHSATAVDLSLEVMFVHDDRPV